MNLQIQMDFQSQKRNWKKKKILFVLLKPMVEIKIVVEMIVSFFFLFEEKQMD